MFARLLGVDLCRGHAQYPAFAPGSSKVAVGFFGLFISFGFRNLPHLPMHTVIFSPIQFLCILLLEERCVQVQGLQHCRKECQVPVLLRRQQSEPGGPWGRAPKSKCSAKTKARLTEPDTQALKHLQVLGSQSAPRSLNFIFSPRWSAVGLGRPQGTCLLPDRPPTHTHTHRLTHTYRLTDKHQYGHRSTKTSHTYVFIDTHTCTQHVNMYRGTHYTTQRLIEAHRHTDQSPMYRRTDKITQSH